MKLCRVLQVHAPCARIADLDSGFRRNDGNQGTDGARRDEKYNSSSQRNENPPAALGNQSFRPRVPKTPALRRTESAGRDRFLEPDQTGSRRCLKIPGRFAESWSC